MHEPQYSQGGTHRAGHEGPGQSESCRSAPNTFRSKKTGKRKQPVAQCTSTCRIWQLNSEVWIESISEVCQDRRPQLHRVSLRISQPLRNSNRCRNPPPASEHYDHNSPGQSNQRRVCNHHVSRNEPRPSLDGMRQSPASPSKNVRSCRTCRAS